MKLISYQITKLLNYFPWNCMVMMLLNHIPNVENGNIWPVHSVGNWFWIHRFNNFTSICFDGKLIKNSKPSQVMIVHWGNFKMMITILNFIYQMKYFLEIGCKDQYRQLNINQLNTYLCKYYTRLVDNFLSENSFSSNKKLEPTLTNG